MISYRRVEKKKKATNYCIRSLVTVRETSCQRKGLIMINVTAFELFSSRWKFYKTNVHKDSRNLTRNQQFFTAINCSNEQRKLFDGHVIWSSVCVVTQFHTHDLASHYLNERAYWPDSVRLIVPRRSDYTEEMHSRNGRAPLDIGQNDISKMSRDFLGRRCPLLGGEGGKEREKGRKKKTFHRKLKPPATWLSQASLDATYVNNGGFVALLSRTIPSAEISPPPFQDTTGRENRRVVSDSAFPSATDDRFFTKWTRERWLPPDTLKRSICGGL